MNKEWWWQHSQFLRCFLYNSLSSAISVNLIILGQSFYRICQSQKRTNLASSPFSGNMSNCWLEWREKLRRECGAAQSFKNKSLLGCRHRLLDKPARLRYLSKSTKITTNIETATPPPSVSCLIINAMSQTHPSLTSCGFLLLIMTITIREAVHIKRKNSDTQIGPRSQESNILCFFTK